MYLKPPIPRMNSPGLSSKYHQPKGCTVFVQPKGCTVFVQPFSYAHKLIKEEPHTC